MSLGSQFSKDHVLRDGKNRPLARVVIPESFRLEAGSPIPVSLLIISDKIAARPEALTYYVDGQPYRIPSDTPRIRFLTANGKHHVNSFVLEPINDK